MVAKLVQIVGVLAFTFVCVEFASGQLPREPRKDLALEVREFPIPFTGYNQAYDNHIAFSKDGLLMAAGAGSNLVVFDVETRKVVTRMQLADQQYSINLAFTADGKSLVYNGSHDPMIRVFDAKTGKQTRERPHSNAPKEPLPRGKDGESQYRNPFIAFAPSGRVMAAYDAGFNKVDLTDPASGERPAHLEKVKIGYYGYMAFSGDGKLLAHSSYWQRAIQIWSMETGELVKTLNARPTKGKDKDKSDGYSQLRFSHDNKFIFGHYRGSGGNDHHVAIYGVNDGLEYCRLPISAYHMEMSPDARMLLAGSNGYFTLYDLVADKRIDKIKLPASHFYNTQRTPDGQDVALLGSSARVQDQSAIYLATFPVLGDDGLPAGRLTVEDERDLWTGLCSNNLFRQRYVKKILKAHADQAVQMAEERVKAVPKAARQKIDELIKALDDADFERRDAALKELRPDAFRFEPLLQETLQSAPAGEVRNRVAFVLNSIRDQPTPADLHSDLRGIELLESLASQAARKALEALADGAPGARTTMEAAAALRRLGK